MITKVPTLDKAIDCEKFIIAHPNEMLSFLKGKSVSPVYTLLFSRCNVNFCFSTWSSSEHVLSKIFRLILLHQLCRFLKTCLSSKTICEKVDTILQTVPLIDIQEEVSSFLTNKKLRRMYFTTEHFFQESYGTLTNICDGYDLYPSTENPIFLPPLAMSKYIGDRKSILFYNKHQVFNILFETYDIDQCVTVINPSPVYNNDCNYVIRNFHNNVCTIRAKFQFQPGTCAKLRSMETNDYNEYLFLLRIHDSYYQVLAIYPPKTVKKNMTVLRKSNKLDILGTDIKCITSQLNTTEKTHLPIRMIFGTLAVDQMLCEKVSISLYEWLFQSVKVYFRNLIFEHVLTQNPALDLESLNFGELKVYEEDGYIQLLLKVHSCSFFYSQKQIDDIEHIQIHFDYDAYVSSEIMRMVRFTSLVRLLVHTLICGSIHPVLNCSDVYLHQQILLYEVKLNRLINLTKVSKNIIF